MSALSTITRPVRAVTGAGRRPPAQPFVGRRVLLTGGGSGLGEATARDLARRGARVLLTDARGDAARRVAREIGQLPGVASGAVAALEHDIRSQEHWVRALDRIDELWGGLDLLVNNAGVASGGPFEQTTDEDWRWVLDVNLLGMITGIRAALPLLRASAGPGSPAQIVNVASLAGLLNPPMMASYDVAKTGVVGLSECLRHELASQGVAVHVVCPSFFRTDLEARARTSDPAATAMIAKLVTGSTVTAETIAGRLLDGVAAGRFLVLTDRDGRTAWFVKRFVPPLFHRQAAAGADRLWRQIERGRAAEVAAEPERTTVAA